MRTLATLALAMLTAAAAVPASAQDWPTRSVKIIVAFSPGGSADQFGRLIAEELSATFGQQFYIEYHPGSSGTIGAALTARAAPDGYTLMIGGSGPHITSPAINPNVGYDPIKDFSHIAMIGADGFVLIANPTLGIGNLADLVKAAHTRQTLGNHIALSMTGLLTSGEQIKAGGVTAVAVTSTERNPVYKDIPTFTEQGYPEVHGDTWFWLTGPKNLPPEIVEKLNREVRRIVKTPKVRDYFQRQAALAMDVDVAGLNTFLAGEVAYWGALAKSVGLSVQ